MQWYPCDLQLILSLAQNAETLRRRGGGAIVGWDQHLQQLKVLMDQTQAHDAQVYLYLFSCTTLTLPLKICCTCRKCAKEALEDLCNWLNGGGEVAVSIWASILVPTLSDLLGLWKPLQIGNIWVWMAIHWILKFCLFICLSFVCLGATYSFSVNERLIELKQCLFPIDDRG